MLHINHFLYYLFIKILLPYRLSFLHHFVIQKIIFFFKFNILDVMHNYFEISTSNFLNIFKFISMLHIFYVIHPKKYIYYHG